MDFTNSKKIYEEALAYIPGGVNSPVRAFGSVGTPAVMIQSAKGSYLYDEDENKFIDYICSWGPMIYGHNDPEILEGFDKQIEKGFSYGLPTKIEVELAKMVVEAYPAIDMVRMVNSGTEATMSAIRVARGYTNRKKILKFEGCYHGHSDALLVQSGSGTLTYNTPTSLGVPEEVVQHTLVGEYNNLEDVERIFDENKDEIACIILEPVAGNMGLVPPSQEFMEGIRKLTKEAGTVLIYDEVITGFRLAYGGASQYFGIEPDMACFGKIIGGGLPVGAFGGKKEIMEMVSPLGGVYQAGTLSGNPLAMFMGKSALNRLKNDPGIYDRLDTKARHLKEGLNQAIQENDIKAQITQVGSLLTLFFTDGDVTSYKGVMESDTDMYAKYFQGMLERGIMLPMAQFECMFVSDTLSQEDIDHTIQSAKEVMAKLQITFELK